MDNYNGFVCFILLLLLASVFLMENLRRILTIKRKKCLPVNGGNEKLYRVGPNELNYIRFLYFLEFNSPFPIKIAVSNTFSSSSQRPYENNSAHDAENSNNQTAFSITRLVLWEHCAVSENASLSWVEHLFSRGHIYYLIPKKITNSS